MTVSVTETDITDGVRANCVFCPIARAIQRQLAAGCEAITGYRHLTVLGPAEPDYTRLTLPDRVTTWITRFDAGEPVEPLTFTLPVPEAYCATH